MFYVKANDTVRFCGAGRGRFCEARLESTSSGGGSSRGAGPCAFAHASAAEAPLRGVSGGPGEGGWQTGQAAPSNHPTNFIHKMSAYPLLVYSLEFYPFSNLLLFISTKKAIDFFIY